MTACLDKTLKMKTQVKHRFIGISYAWNIEHGGET